MTTKKNTTKKSNIESKQDLAKDIFLVLSIGFCLLLFLSNFGIVGKFGNALAGFFFGLFGVISYIFPILLLASIFFIAVFYRIRYESRLYPSIIVALSSVVYLGIATIIELVVHGERIVGPSMGFDIGYDEKSGGGFFGSLFAFLYSSGFGIVGAYVITIIILVVAGILIYYFAFRKEDKKKCGMFDKVGHKTQKVYRQNKDNKRRENNRKKVEEIKRQKDEERGLNFDENTRRMDRKISGVDFKNTAIKDIEPISAPIINNNNIPTPTIDGMNEININMLDDKNDEEISPTEVSRVSLKSSELSKSNYHFVEDDFEKDINEDYNSHSIDNDNKYENNTFNNLENIVENSIDDKDDFANKSDNSFDNINNKTNTLENNLYSNANNVNNTLNVNNTTIKNNLEKEASLVSSISNNTSRQKKSNYKYPPLNLLTQPQRGGGETKQGLKDKAEKLLHVLSIFGVNAELGEITCGPTVTRFEIIPEIGTKVSKIVNLADDIQLNLAAKSIRIEAPIPGKSSVGIEIPNDNKTAVSFYDLMRDTKFKNSKSKISFALGKDIPGNIIIGDLAKMPHLLIAGTTGSGKSVCVNSIIMSILYKASPDEVGFIMIDPKMVEFTKYNGLPHLLAPVVTDAKKAPGALAWAVGEMMNRYDKLSKAGVNKFDDYNKKVETGQIKITNDVGEEIIVNEKMKQIVIVIDELADLMMVAAKEVEASICRIAQLARAAGIHLIVATQRPSADIVTGLIKTNIPSRIALSVSTSIDSRVIIDTSGAEDLLGNGDMLYSPVGSNVPIRVQGVYVPDDDIRKVLDYIIEHNEYEKDDDLQSQIESAVTSINAGEGFGGNYEKDQYFEDCGRLIIDKGKGSIGMLQRNFRIGFNRAARIMDQLEDAGVVGPEEGTKPRRVLITMDDFEEILRA